MKHTKNYRFILKVEQTDAGLVTQMDFSGFDPMTVLGILELQKNEILFDLREQENLLRQSKKAMSSNKNNQA